MPDLQTIYERFVIGRHRVWEQRQAGRAQPWSHDPILQRRKFTNVFRVLDPGSQFAVRILNEPGLNARETLARALLYRFTNKPEPWEAFRAEFGRYPLIQDMMYDTLAEFWKEYRAQRGPVFSGAYMILPEPNRRGDKVEQAVRLPLRVLTDSWDAFRLAPGAAAQHAVLMTNYGVGSFMAMQVLTDLGYSTQGSDRENSFVAEGPGSIRGAALLRPGTPAREAIAELREEWLDHPLCPVVLAHGQYRPLSLMDVQNTLCEFDKYHRYWSGRQPLPGLYRPAHPGPQPAPVYPPAWAERNQ